MSVTASDLPRTPSARSRTQPGLGHDLYVVGLPAREADGLRDALVRAAVQVDPDAEDAVVCIPAWTNRRLSMHVLLGLLERWARAEGFGELVLRYGGRSYRLATYLRREPREREASAQ